MKGADYVREIPDSAASFGRRESLWRRLHIDPWVLALLLIVSGGGLVVLYSASSRDVSAVLRQASFLSAGLITMLLVAQLRATTIRRWLPWVYVAGLVLLIATEFVGVGAKGAQRWLALPGLPRFQPSELSKLVVPLSVASYLAATGLRPSLKQILVCLLLILTPVLLVLMQPDLGTSILITGAGIIVLFLGGLSWGYVAAVLMAMSIAAPLMWNYVLYDYQKQRVLTLLDPESDRLGAGWNIIQSKTAIGSGGMDGKGWLSGTQSHLDFLPEGHTDFIIAVLSEEFGFRGVVLLLALYVLLIGRCLVIAVNAQDSFSRLSVAGITLTFFVYICVNMGMVSGLLPVVGVPLPLISQGGTSIISLLVGFGIVMSVATERRRMHG